MKKFRNSTRLSFTAALAVTFTFLLLPFAAHAANISKTAMAGPYTVNLKVLPAEAFTGPNHAMIRDGGAKPEDINGPMHPNHHMVVFIKKAGKPVEHARVKIWYRMAMSKKMGSGMMGNNGMMSNHSGSGMMSSNSSMMSKKDKKMMRKECKWMKLPVVRMHVAGHGLSTTHFGNNLHLKSGNYEVKVKVDGHTATFHIML